MSKDKQKDEKPNPEVKVSDDGKTKTLTYRQEPWQIKQAEETAKAAKDNQAKK